MEDVDDVDASFLFGLSTSFSSESSPKNVRSLFGIATLRISSRKFFVFHHQGHANHVDGLTCRLSRIRQEEAGKEMISMPVVQDIRKLARIGRSVDLSHETAYEGEGVVTERGRIERFGQRDHLRVFGVDSERVLLGAGFEVRVARGADCPDEIRPVTGPADYDFSDIFFCWKP